MTDFFTSDLGLWGLFLSSFLSATLLPGGSEAALFVVLKAYPETLWIALIVASIGNTLGGMVTFGMGWLASVLAPTFGGQSNLVQGLKLAVFGGTPMMLAGVFNLLPALSIIGLLVALYSLYVMYLGLPVLMSSTAWALNSAV